ncbi:MAG: hypothetical protein Satyrvirus27_19, partial [Satyrvirus sp.]
MVVGTNVLSEKPFDFIILDTKIKFALKCKIPEKKRESKRVQCGTLDIIGIVFGTKFVLHKGTKLYDKQTKKYITTESDEIFCIKQHKTKEHINKYGSPTVFSASVWDRC